VRPEATKLSKPPGELNPQVWQGDCSLGIDQNGWRMFWIDGGGLTLVGTSVVTTPTG